MSEIVAESAERGMLWTGSQRARLVRLCTAIVHDAGAGEDLAQETLLEAWRFQHRLTDTSGADAWLSAIARNVCRRWLRAQGRVPTPTEPIERAGVTSEAAHRGGPPVGNADLDAVLEREELVELLDRALALLPPATRDALVSHYIEERSHAEIAARIGTSADAVSMRVSRGKTRLRYLLETRFADDAVAEGWVRRADVGWLPTKLRCVSCGGTAISMRHTPTEIAFRCQSCDPNGLATRLPLDTSVFSSLVGDLRRPSAIQARTAAWSMSYWSSDQDTATVSCVRCERSAPRLPYTREGHPHWSGRHGWYAACPACGEQVSSSIDALALAQPEIRAVRRLEPRLRSLPVREVVRDGAPAKIVGFAGPDGAELASAIFLRDSYRLIHVASSADPRAAVEGG